MEKNIEYVVKNRMCNGCGTCISLCPQNAIRLELNSKIGLFQPTIDIDSCNNCGICYKICPGIGMNFDKINSELFGQSPKEPIIGNYVNLYVGNSKDKILNKACSSGGVITELLLFALEKKIITGAIITRMNKDSPLNPETFIARSKEEIIEASKSKYCPTSPNIVLKEIINSKKDDRLAFVGLGCHIHGIRNAQTYNKVLRDKIWLCIELFCSHTDSFLATEYILNWNNIKKNEVIKIDYRGNGWPGCMHIELENGTTKEIPYKEYITVHELYIFSPPRCKLCYDGIGELSDISIGDAWGIIDKHDLGKSLCIVRTKKGNELIEKCCEENRLELDSLNEDEVINSQGLLSANRFRKVKCQINLNVFSRKKNPLYKKANIDHTDYNPTYLNYIQLILLDLHKSLFSIKALWRFTYRLINLEIVLMKKIKLKK